MLDLGRLTIFISSEKTDIQVVPWILKVVRISPEKGDVELRSKYEPDVGVFLVGVEVILSPLIEGNDVIAEPILVSGFFLDLGHRRAAHHSGLGIVHARRDLAIDSFRDV